MAYGPAYALTSSTSAFDTLLTETFFVHSYIDEHTYGRVYFVKRLNYEKKQRCGVAAGEGEGRKWGETCNDSACLGNC